MVLRPAPIVDTMPFFALMLIPVMDWVWRRKAMLGLFLVLVAWSVVVQGVGAFAYDMLGWNRRGMAKVYLEGRAEPVIVETLADVERLQQTAPVRHVQEIAYDIDDPANRHRLWSLSDNEILYYLKNFKKSRDARAQMCEVWLQDPAR